MDLENFNKLLRKKIAVAVKHQNHHNIEAAIRQWIEISEMSLKASKSPELSANYRNMLINKIKQILQHVKSLKSQVSPSFTEDYSLEETYSEDTIVDEVEHMQVQESYQSHTVPKESPPKTEEIKVVKDSQFKNLPKGVQEIETSEDFKIITPHNPNYVEEMEKIAENIDYSALKRSDQPQQDSMPSSVNIDLEEGAPEGAVICFACGYDENPPNTKKCKNCGIDLN